MAKQKSSHAAAAAEIRKELKKHGIEARVRSESYSMGSSVRVRIFNQPPWVAKKIEAFANQYQYGHFDGMQDLYEYSNRRDDLPQVKFVFVDNEFSDEMREAAWKWYRETFAEAAEAPEDYKQAGSWHSGHEWGDSIIWRALSGAYIGGPEFWEKPTIRVELEAA